MERMTNPSDSVCYISKKRKTISRLPVCFSPILQEYSSVHQADACTTYPRS